MRHQARRPIAVTLGALLLAAVPAQAGPVEYRDVVTLSSAFSRGGGASVDLRLRSFTQQQGKSNGQPNSIAGIAQDPKSGPAAGTSGEGAATAAPDAPASLIGAEIAPQEQQTTVETIELGEVDGTLCDCGEIVIPGGGFPLWPLLGLAGVPLFFLPGGDDNPQDFPTFTPPPPPPPEIPEPATLLLFGSGLAALGAGARRRRARQSKLQQAVREV
jgi:hypothetical protein